MTNRTFTCGLCRGTFDVENDDWTEADAEAEYLRCFPNAADRGDGRAQVCDDCYRHMTTAVPPIEWDARRAALIEKYEQELVESSERVMEHLILYGDSRSHEGPGGILHATKPKRRR